MLRKTGKRRRVRRQGGAEHRRAADAQANAQDTNLISSATSRIPVAVERTNEEWVAAWHATRLLGAH